MLVHAMHTAGMNAPVLLDCFVAMTSHVFCVSEFFRERMTKHNHAAFLLSEDLRPPSRVVKVVCMESCPRAVDA